MQSARARGRCLDDLLEGETPAGFGRGLYKGVSCGPWISFVVRTPLAPRTVYYESVEASKEIKDCVAVRVGSIVEGSEVGVAPVTLTFPFRRSEFYRVVSAINAKAKRLWAEANIGEWV